jgi:hypothetical protein
MIIDLDSWEIGCADGRLGRSPEYPVNRDQVSYSAVMSKVAGLASGAEKRFDCTARFHITRDFDRYASFAHLGSWRPPAERKK